jgi:hypothetical protein
VTLSGIVALSFPSCRRCASSYLFFVCVVLFGHDRLTMLQEFKLLLQNLLSFGYLWSLFDSIKDFHVGGMDPQELLRVATSKGWNLASEDATDVLSILHPQPDKGCIRFDELCQVVHRGTDLVRKSPRAVPLISLLDSLGESRGNVNPNPGTSSPRLLEAKANWDQIRKKTGMWKHVVRSQTAGNVRCAFVNVVYTPHPIPMFLNNSALPKNASHITLLSRRTRQKKVIARRNQWTWTTRICRFTPHLQGWSTH